MNPYDPCVANKTIKGKQCTICCYVDDTKISHQDTSIVDLIIQQIEMKFGKMTVARGRKHIFVEVNIKFMNDGTVKLSMDDFVNECIAIYGTDVKKQSGYVS